MEIKICQLYPDVLNLYGDQGNITCLRSRLQWRGIEVQTLGLPVGEMADLCDFDVIFIGGGMPAPQQPLINDLHNGRAAQLAAAVDSGVTVLAVCEGYELMGKYCITPEGGKVDCAGVVNFYTKLGHDRLTGDCLFECGEESGGSRVVSFENHGGRVYLGEGVSPLGRVIKGHGNNGEDGTEGARYKNFFGSYGHGPLLPKNPALADFILRTALERKYPGYVLEPLDDTLENNAHSFMLSRLEK
ncbi:MAG: type 1 glutamine amidotransferase [Oscillospiraceae bacterium]|jgi:CobQ-like glutamine amidotransferase family enzyme